MGWLKDLWDGKPKEGEALFAQVTDQSFAELVLKAEKPVMLFLWSGTCVYCRKMVPNVKNVLQRNSERIIGVHANTAEAPAIVQALDLRGVPATVFFLKGKVVEIVAGFRPEEYLEQVIEKLGKTVGSGEVVT